MVDSGYKPKFEWRFLGPDFWPLWLVVGLLALLMVMPGIVRQRVGKILARRVLIKSNKRRHIVSTNLAMCFPEKSEKARDVMVRRYFEYYAMAMLDYGLAWFGRPWLLNRRVKVRGIENIENAYLSDRRIIILGCHSPGLDIGVLEISRRYPMVAMMKVARNGLFNWLLCFGRTRFNNRLVERSEGIRKLITGIRKKNVLYYIPDEDLGATAKTEFLPFFGIPTATLTTLGRMAEITHAVVVPVITHYDRKKDQYVVKCLPPLNNFPSGDDMADSTAMNRAIEEMIREEPEQYMWSLRLFQTRPEGEPSVYDR